MTWLRLTFRLQRSTIVFAAFVCLGLSGVATWLAMNMRPILAQCETSAAPDGCGDIHLFGSPIAEPATLTLMVIGLAMYAVPLVLGVPVLTREIEQRTAMIAWPLAGSRLKWLAWRAGSVLVVGLVLIGIMAFAAEQLARASDPDTDLGFLAHGVRDISLVTRSTLMFVAAIALGAVIGRLLPSLLVGVALAVVISTAVYSLVPYGVEPTELRPIEVTPTEAVYEGGHPLHTGDEYRAPDGTPISHDEAAAMNMAGFEEPYTVSYGIAGTRYSEVLVRESAVLVGATVLFAGVAAAVVQRRRPE